MTERSLEENDEFANFGFPWADQEFPFIYTLVQSIRQMQGEIALAMGGSFAARSNVPLSDLDLFLYVADQDAYACAQRLRTLFSSHPSVITSCPVQHYDSFGHRCAWTLHNSPVVIVELFVSSNVDLRVTVMAKMNRLIIDNSSTYRKHLAESCLTNGHFNDETLELIIHNLLACAHKTRKELNSNAFFQAANRFYKFRMAILPVLIFIRTGIIHHPLVGEKHTAEFKGTDLDAIRDSYMLRCEEDVFFHFKVLTSLILPGIDALCEGGRLEKSRASLIIQQLREYALLDHGR